MFTYHQSLLDGQLCSALLRHASRDRVSRQQHATSQQVLPNLVRKQRNAVTAARQNDGISLPVFPCRPLFENATAWTLFFRAHICGTDLARVLFSNNSIIKIAQYLFPVDLIIIP